MKRYSDGLEFGTITGREPLMAPAGTVCCHCGRHFRKPDEACENGFPNPKPILARALMAAAPAVRRARDVREFLPR